jgi:hypothetical protein
MRYPPGFNAESAMYETKRLYHTLTSSGLSIAQVSPEMLTSNVVVMAMNKGCRGACKCCAALNYNGCCELCDDCIP